MIENDTGQSASLWQYVTHADHGAEWVELSDNLIGLVENGAKTIQYAHARYTVRSGEVFSWPRANITSRTYPRPTVRTRRPAWRSTIG